MQIPSRWETREKRPLCTRTAAKECGRPVAARFRNLGCGKIASLSFSLSRWASRLRRRESVDDAHGRGKRRLSGVGTGWLNNIDRYSVFGTRFKRSGQLASFSFSRVKGVYVWFKFKRFSRFLSFFFISLCTCYTSLYCFHLFSIRDTTGYWTNYHSFANLIWKL